MSKTTASRVMSGSYIQIWMDGVQIGEASALQVKINKNYEDVEMAGDGSFTDRKLHKMTITGSLSRYKIYSNRSTAEALKAGGDPRCTLMYKLDDPDAFGAERAALYNVSFDDLTLMDASMGKVCQETSAFRATDVEFLDSVERS